jgi:superfamily II DNA/RNA helicase
MNQPPIDDILKRLQISSLNSMQLATLEASRTHHELVLLSPTGSGKTLGFLLPLLSSLKEEVKGVQALILSPSRELALQIEQVFKSMGSGYKINACYGGHPFKTEKNNLSQVLILLQFHSWYWTSLISRWNLDSRKICLLSCLNALVLKNEC